MEIAMRELVIVTGLSGAGKSVTLKALEDLGFEAIDNVPLSILGQIMSVDTQCDAHGKRRPLAIGIDIRTRDFDVATIQGLLQQVENDDVRVRILFLDCSDEALQRRYTETRRRHPLAMDRPLQDGINIERKLLEELRDNADDVIDTTDLSSTALKTMLISKYSQADIGLHVFVTSFSYRRGLPREADLVFDVRFLRNPHYDETLRESTGQEEAVQRYIAEDPDFADFVNRLESLLDPLLPRYVSEGKSYLTLAFGCTGGRHRSVFMAELMGQWIKAQGHGVSIRHRELSK